ncbi:MAG: TlpA family protein disulfide reductase [Bacteroidia bacterium]
MNKRVLISLLSLLLCMVACKDDELPYTITLDDYAVPAFKYGSPPHWMDWRREFGTEMSSDMARKVAYARIRALRSGNFRQGGKGIRIGVFDADQNRKFNDIGVDYITVGTFAADTLPIFNGVASVTLSEFPFTVALDGEYYRVEAIAEDGKSLALSPSQPVDSPLAYLPTHLPEVDIQTIDGDTLALKQFLEPNKYLYIESWSTWYQAGIDGLPDLKAAHSRFEDRLTVLHLVMNEVDYSRVEKYVDRYDLPWVQAIFTDELGRKLMQNSIPYGILFAPDGTIIKSGLGPGELEPFLESVL